MFTRFRVTSRVIILALMMIGFWGGSGSSTAAAQVDSVANTPSSGESLLKKYPQRNALPTQANDNASFVSSPFNLYAEAFGTAGFGSINAEFVRPISSDQGLALRTGYSRLDAATIIPLSVSLLHGPGSHKFEIGAGLSIAFTGSDAYLFPSALIGYRFQSRADGPLFRIGLTPLLLTWSDDGITDTFLLPWGGVSFGWGF